MKTKHITKGALVGVFVLMPVITFAVRTLADLIDLFIYYLGYAIPLIMSLAIVVFIWGIYQHFFKADADKKEAGNFILYGVLGFFLMLSFWGLVNILINTFGLQTNNVNGGIPFIRSSGGSGAGAFDGGGDVYRVEGRSTIDGSVGN